MPRNGYSALQRKLPARLELLREGMMISTDILFWIISLELFRPSVLFQPLLKASCAHSYLRAEAKAAKFISRGELCHNAVMVPYGHACRVT